MACSCNRTVAPFVASFQHLPPPRSRVRSHHMYVCEGVARRRSVGCLSRYSAVTSCDDVQIEDEPSKTTAMRPLYLLEG